MDRVNATFSEQNRNRFSDALKNVTVLSQRLAETAEPLKELVGNANNIVKSFDKELQNLSQSTQHTLTNIDVVAHNISEYFSDNKNALNSLTQNGSYEILQTLSDTREMVTTARRFFEKLDQNPRGLIFETQRKGISVPLQ